MKKLLIVAALLGFAGTSLVMADDMGTMASPTPMASASPAASPAAKPHKSHHKNSSTKKSSSSSSTTSEPKKM